MHDKVNHTWTDFLKRSQWSDHLKMKIEKQMFPTWLLPLKFLNSSQLVDHFEYINLKLNVPPSLVPPDTHVFKKKCCWRSFGSWWANHFECKNLRINFNHQYQTEISTIIGTTNTLIYMLYRLIHILDEAHIYNVYNTIHAPMSNLLNVNLS